MRAAVTRAGKLAVEDVPDPVPQAGQLLVRTLACGICGSDVHALQHPEAFSGTMSRSGGSPHEIGDGIVFGHEFAAEIVGYGPDTVRSLPVGSIVCGPPIGSGPAGSAIIGYSRDFPGGFGEYMVLTEGCTYPVPNGLSPQIAALTEPFSVAARAVRRSESAPDSVAVVIGLGPMGLAVVAGLKARRQQMVVAVDFSPRRRALAERLGADLVLDPAAQSPYDCWDSLGVVAGMVERMAAEYRGIRTTDTVIYECVGAPGLLAQVTVGAPAGATIMLVGVCLGPDAVDPGLVVGKELDIRGSFGASPAEYRRTLRDIAEGRIDAGAILTGTTGLAGLPEAFAELAAADRHAKIVVEPGSAADRVG